MNKNVLSTLIVRSIWTIAMIAGFICVVLGGHLYSVILVGLLEILAFREVIKITRDPNEDAPRVWTRNVSWYFLISTMFYLEGDALIKFFGNVGIPFYVLDQLAKYHQILSYLLFTIGFMFFVVSLKPGYYKQQYAHLSVTFMALLLIVVQGHFVGENVLHGLFWFLIPASLVIVNDIMAYLCGISFGRTPLIAISPKKTVEGFVGAWICTVIFGGIITWFASTSWYMICPMERIDVSAFSDYTCTPNPVFVPTQWNVPLGWINHVLGLFGPLQVNTVWTFPPIYLHSMVLSSYASLIAPFGGFFASGLKRAVNIKDFGDTIPGHGGVTDRFDCQFIMGFFAYLYYNAFVAPAATVDTSFVVNLVNNLSPEQQQVVLESLAKL